MGWGYPAWWPYFTAVLEVAVGALLIFPQTRLVGVALGCLIMLAANATVLRAKELAHAVPPAIVLLFTAAIHWFG